MSEPDADVPVTVRGGVPNFALRAFAGRPARIVAFGTSLTKAGYYLEPLAAHLAAMTGNDGIVLRRHGLSSASSSIAVHRFGEHVTPLAPDLLILEFSINDDYWDEALQCAEPLVGMLSQLLHRYPACDVVFVYFAAAGNARSGQTAATQAHERVADSYGIPSFDLSHTAELLVRSGRCTWTGSDARALTSDGVHYRESTVTLLGEPFARRFGELLRLSANRMPHRLEIPKNVYASATAVSAASVMQSGSWRVADADDVVHSAGHTFGDRVTIVEPGTAFGFRFAGTVAGVWLLLSTEPLTLAVSVDGVERRSALRLDEGMADSAFGLVPLLDLDERGEHDIEVVNVNARPVVFGDLFLLGRASPLRVRGLPNRPHGLPAP